MDTCPSYNPDDKSDPYPGQPFLEDVEQPKTKSYDQNTYIYNPPHPYIHSDNRRQSPAGETLELTASAVPMGLTCRVHTKNADVAQCDENYQAKGVPEEEISETDVPSIACNKVTDNCDDSEFDSIFMI